MLAKNAKLKPAAEGKPKAMVRTVESATPEPNPLWHSLALHPAGIQAKLTISAPHDPYEQEADRVADQVMRMSVPIALSTGQTPNLQRKCGGCAGADPIVDRVMRMGTAESNQAKLSLSPVTAVKAARKCTECEEDEEMVQRKEGGTGVDSSEVAPQVVRQVLSSSGRPIDPSTRAFFEPRFGFDFGHVRIHNDALAVESARAVQALAYTVGQDVVFGNGEYSPETDTGKTLIAHELAHVVQQSGVARGRGVAGINHPSDREASRAGGVAPTTQSALPRLNTSPGEATIQRQRRRRPRRQQQGPSQAPRPPFNPPEGRWVLVSLQSVGSRAGGRGLVRVYDGTTLRHTFHASGGRPRATTPVGEFHIDWRDLPHESNRHGNCVHVPRPGQRRRAPRGVTTGAAECRDDERFVGADMHYFQRFAPSVGFHRGNPSRVSHGCIHLEESAASTLWGAIHERTRVFVCPGEGCQWYLDGIRAERTREAEQAREAAQRRR